MKFLRRVDSQQITHLSLFGLFYFLACFALVVVLGGGATSATGCNEQYPRTVTYGGTTTADDGLYDVYVKLPKRGQQANVTVFQETFDQTGEISCKPTKSVPATGDRWTKVSRWHVTNDQVSAYLVSAALPDEYGANRPSLMLISATEPVCQPTTECYTSTEGHRGVIVPATERLDENGLIIAVPHSLQQDTLSHVEYYVDDVLMYSTPTLEDFDRRYISFADQKLARVLQYWSGQQVVINDTSSSSHTDSFLNFLFRVFNTGSITSKWLFVAAAGALALIIGYTVAKQLYQRRNWRIRHGFIKERQLKQLTPVQLERDHRRRTYLRYTKKGLAGVAALCLVILVTSLLNRYVITINQVNGVSMEETLMDGTRLAVNRFSVTWNNVVGKQFIPKRGAIVTLKEVYGNQLSQAQNSSSYRTLVKRVIGLPGERVIVKNGAITVFNKENPGGFNPDIDSDWSDTMIADLSTEVLDIQLLQNEVFVIGDNRLASVDSRMNGPIALSNIQGQLIAPLPF